VKLARLAVVHQLPLERYPPVGNLLECLDEKHDIEVLVLSSPRHDDSFKEQLGSGRVQSNVRRLSCHSRWMALRWLRTLLWHCRTAWELHRFRPHVVLSVEPHSAVAVWLHRNICRGRARLVIQHYEYYSEDDYRRPGNRLLRLNRLFERSLLKQADRVTQTNPDRLRLFLADNPQLRADQLSVWPNYPPKSWLPLPERQWPVNPTGPLRLVIAGAVSLRDTCIGPLAEWINSERQTACTLDIYANSIDAETEAWLRHQIGDRLRYHPGGVPYAELPRILQAFDVGLILYRCHTVNFVWNATNKLFEYLLCGLDVWYPPCMSGVAPYARSTAAPRVLETDFESLQTLDLAPRQTRSHLPSIPWTTTCEDALQPLLELLVAAEHSSTTKHGNNEDQID